MAMVETPSNKDLVRDILSKSSHSAPLLSTSRELRGNESCAVLFEKWAAQNCPKSPHDPREAACLAAVGGAGNRFCTGSFDVTTLDANGWPTVEHDVQVGPFAERVSALLSVHDKNPRVLTVVVLVLGEYTLRVKLTHDTDGTAQNVITLVQGEWRNRGTPCRVMREHACGLIKSVLTSSGIVEIPCQPGSNARGPVFVPRVVHLRLSRYDTLTNQEWLTLSAVRK